MLFAGATPSGRVTLALAPVESADQLAALSTTKAATYRVMPCAGSWPRVAVVTLLFTTTAYCPACGLVGMESVAAQIFISLASVLIEGIQKSASGTIDDIEKITGVINTGNDIVSGIAASVEEQAVTTREIAENVNHASEGVSEINDNAVQGLSASEKIADDISSINKDAGRLSDSSSSLTVSAGEMSMLAEVLQERVGRFNVSEDEGRSAGNDMRKREANDPEELQEETLVI